MNYCIYAHKNKKNNKIYIGQTCQDPPSKRWERGKGYKENLHFYSAIKQDGWDNFEHIILEQNLTLEQANEREKYWIQYYNSTNDKYGYNLTTGGKNAPKTESHKKKISESNIGKHPHQGKLNPMFGKHCSEETKQKIRRNQPNTKAIICIETGEIFESAHLAAAKCGLQHDGHIPEVCRGSRKSAGGYHWKYLEDVND